MNGQQLFSSGSFAKLSRTTRPTLHLYDSIGLLTPTMRGENNYRYYSSQQLSTINVIRILQELGMTLDEINTIKDQRTPEFVNNIMTEQIDKIDKKINEWVQARKLLQTLQKSIESSLGINEENITIQFLPAEAIVIGGLNDYSKGRSDYDALLSFYKEMHERYPDLDLNYPVWARYSESRVRSGDLEYPDRYYFYNPEGYDKRPAAIYAIGYGRGGYGTNDEIYKRIIDYINKNDFEICGDAYEEYPQNELSVADSNNYLIRVMITVRKKI